MFIHLVRHAHAGNRSAWTGDDADRPLSTKGQAQAEAIADDLAKTTGGLVELGLDDDVQLWASPYLRCLQTLEPLGTRLDIEVRSAPELAEGRGGATALDLLLAAGTDASSLVACSHGDVIPAIVATALGRGATLEGDVHLRKAARYVVHVEDGRVVRLTHVPRPEV